MRFFTDQYFTEEQKVQLQGNSPLKLHMPIKPVTQQKSAEHRSVEPRTFQRETEMLKFEQTSKRIEFIFLGGIVSVIVAAALLDFISTSHVLAV